jgi:hypothetical protein
MSRCSFLSNACFPWPPLLMLSLAIIHFCWLLYPVLLQSLKCNINCYRAVIIHNLCITCKLDGWGKEEFHLCVCVVTLVLTCIGSILLHFLVCMHSLRRDCLYTEATDRLSMNGGADDALHFSLFQICYYELATSGTGVA